MTTHSRKNLYALLAFLLAAIVMAGPAAAAAKESDDAEMTELQERFKARFPALAEMKSAGRIGEMFEGYVGVVKEGDKDAGALANEENTDRKALYRLIAKKQNTTPEHVARENAERLFEKAKKGEYLKGEDGVWKQQ